MQIEHTGVGGILILGAEREELLRQTDRRAEGRPYC